MALVNVTGFGLMQGLLVVWRGNLLAAMGFHTVWNWLQGMVLGFDVSGLELHHSVMTTARTTGSHSWLTGEPSGRRDPSLTRLSWLSLLLAFS